MTVNEKAREYAGLIENALEAGFTFDEKDLNKTVKEAVRYSLLGGGKRVRPSLCLAFCELSGADARTALSFACAVEMIHVYSLIHDDLPCMDNDDMRRGKPACHIAYSEAVAMLAGDALLTKAFETASQAVMAGVSAENTVEAVKRLAALAGADGMIGGQTIDLEHEGKNAPVEVLLEMDKGKTVALIEAACVLGCIAAGAGESLLEAASAYAENLGMAFQIRDDILGAGGDADLLGKTVGLDEKNGKSNYVSLYGIDTAQKLVNDYTRNAVNALDMFSGDSSFLKEFAESMASRDR